MSRRMLLLPLLTQFACAAEAVPYESEARLVAQAVVGSCPMADPASAAARDACSQSLRRHANLDLLVANAVLWGGHNPEKHASLKPAAHELTEFDDFVW